MNTHGGFTPAAVAPPNAIIPETGNPSFPKQVIPPASSLDALSEAEIFGKFKTIIAGRSAILISHRFSTVLMADRIYVLARGRIVEHGSHADLMAMKGRYATMFLAQADAYCH